jgi:hypothetical protein
MDSLFGVRRIERDGGRCGRSVWRLAGSSSVGLSLRSWYFRSYKRLNSAAQNNIGFKTSIVGN